MAASRCRAEIAGRPAEASLCVKSPLPSWSRPPLLPRIPTLKNRSGQRGRPQSGHPAAGPAGAAGRRPVCAAGGGGEAALRLAGQGAAAARQFASQPGTALLPPRPCRPVQTAAQPRQTLSCQPPYLSPPLPCTPTQESELATAQRTRDELVVRMFASPAWAASRRQNELVDTARALDAQAAEVRRGRAASSVARAGGVRQCCRARLLGRWLFAAGWPSRAWCLPLQQGRGAATYGRGTQLLVGAAKKLEGSIKVRGAAASTAAPSCAALCSPWLNTSSPLPPFFRAGAAGHANAQHDGHGPRDDAHGALICLGVGGGGWGG